MVKRTYSRRSQTPQTYANDAPTKRRRVQDWPESVSPTRSVTENSSSDPLQPISSPLPHRSKPSGYSYVNSSPPSSPPSAKPTILDNDQITQTETNQPRKFASNSRIQPLKDTSGNAQKTKPKKQQKLTQLTLDLGQRTQRRCPTCGMEYRPSSPEDIALHSKFHAQNVGGIDLGKSFVASILIGQKVWSGPSGEMIIVVNRAAEARKRRVVESVLDVVEKELGGVGIDREELWSGISAPSNKDSKSAGHSPTKSDRYKAYLYIRGHKCIGVCLTERIREGFEVQLSESSHTRNEQRTSTQSSSITISSEPKPATLGVSRIWTSTFARRSGVAKKMLDCGLDNFLYGMRIPKDMVAFSQPTESGGNLARSWFGKESGWLVYND